MQNAAYHPLEPQNSAVVPELPTLQLDPQPDPNLGCVRREVSGVRLDESFIVKMMRGMRKVCRVAANKGPARLRAWSDESNRSITIWTTGGDMCTNMKEITGYPSPTKR